MGRNKKKKSFWRLPEMKEAEVVVKEKMEKDTENYLLPSEANFRIRYGNIKRHIIISCMITFFWGAHVAFLFFIRDMVFFNRYTMFFFGMFSTIIFLIGSASLFDLFWVIKYGCADVKVNEFEIRVNYGLVGKEEAMSWGELKEIKIEVILPWLRKIKFFVMKLKSKDKHTIKLFIISNNESYEVAKYLTRKAKELGIRLVC